MIADWTCHLLKSSPRYADWRVIMESDAIPIISPLARPADLGSERDVEVYELDLPRLTPDQRGRLIDWIVRRFGAPRDQVEAEIAAVGFPIRAADVSVAIDMRFVI